MKILIIRHGKVDYQWSTLCSSGTFDKEYSEYDKAPLMKAAMQSSIKEQPMIYISSLRRSRETAEKLWPNANYIETHLVILLTFEHLINCSVESDLAFRPLSPKQETKLYLIWNKYQTFTPIAEKFLAQVRDSF